MVVMGASRWMAASGMTRETPNATPTSPPPVVWGVSERVRHSGGGGDWSICALMVNRLERIGGERRRVGVGELDLLVLLDLLGVVLELVGVLGVARRGGVHLGGAVEVADLAAVLGDGALVDRAIRVGEVGEALGERVELFP